MEDEMFIIQLFTDSDEVLTLAEDQLLLEISAQEEIEETHRKRPKNTNYLEVVSKYSDHEFKEHFRVSRRIAEHLALRFEQSPSYLPPSSQYGKLTPLEQVQIFLWFAGHQTASFRDVADRFNITISSLFRVNIRMIYFISGLAGEVIRWPSTAERRNIEAAFRTKGFPGVIGVIDGTHVKLDKPTIDPDSYLNRKKYYSIHMQAVCDDQLRFRSVFIGFPGSVHDARVFGRSDVGQNLEEMCGDKIILGDSAYPCLRNLITPFKDFGNLTRAHKNFNRKLSSCRCVIEHSFGVLKQRFRQLYHCKLRSMQNITHFIRACCVLHNLMIDVDPETQNFEPSYASDVEDAEVEDASPVDERAPDTREGVAYRQYLLSVIT